MYVAVTVAECGHTTCAPCWPVPPLVAPSGPPLALLCPCWPCVGGGWCSPTRLPGGATRLERAEDSLARSLAGPRVPLSVFIAIPFRSVPVAGAVPIASRGGGH